MKENRRTFCLTVCVTLASAGLLLFPEHVSAAVSSGLTMCFQVLLPTLFPFMVLSGFMINSGAAEIPGRCMQRLMAPVFHLPGVCFTPLLLGVIGGYPTGAKSVANLYRSGSCSRQEAEHALAFCNNCGPGFLLGTIGCGMFGELRYGLLLFSIHVLAGFLTGIILAPPTAPVFRSLPESHPTTVCGFDAFVSSITDAMQTFLNLSAFVLCFSAITALIRLSGIPSALAGCLPISAENGSQFLVGLLELSGGVLQLSDGSISERLVLTAILVSWGGFSVHCQVMSILQHTDLSPRLYWRGKAIQAVLSGLFTGCIISGSWVLISVSVVIGLIALHLKKSSGNYRESIL